MKNLIIRWAKQFEAENIGAEWGINTKLDHIEAIEQFAAIKIQSAVNSGVSYIDTDIIT